MSTEDPKNDTQPEDRPAPEEENQSSEQEPQQEENPLHFNVNIDAERVSSTFQRLFTFLKFIINIRNGVSAEGTVKTIKDNIDFSGYNIWILGCSIGIASIGLNSNSPAIIIGAMLISPLMGPIRGIGLAAGINDIPLLLRSLKNFGIMIAVSLLVSFFFFWLNPLKSETEELMARTHPQILDVMVAFLGGLAGIIAASRNDVSTVVPGVAIATALMPPLCTAGYGLAIGDMSYFFGASYLFLLNSLFICLSTLLIVKYLRFPVVSFVDKKIQKRVQWFIIGFLLLIIIPSAFKFVDVLKESLFIARSQEYVNTVIAPYEDAYLNNSKFIYEGSDSRIEVSMIGKPVPKEITREWRRRLSEFGLTDVTLEVFQNESIQDKGISSEYLMQNQRMHMRDVEELSLELAQKQDEVRILSKRLVKLERFQTDIDRFNQKIRFAFPELSRYYYAPSIVSSEKGEKDTIITIITDWKPSADKLNSRNKKLEEWARIELNKKNVYVLPYNNQIPEKLEDEQEEIE